MKTFKCENNPSLNIRGTIKFVDGFFNTSDEREADLINLVMELHPELCIIHVLSDEEERVKQDAADAEIKEQNGGIKFTGRDVDADVGESEVKEIKRRGPRKNKELAGQEEAE